MPARLVACLAVAFPLLAAAGPVQLTPPAGWQASSKDGLTLYVPTDVAVGVVQFVVFPARPLSGSFETAYAQARAELERGLGLSAPSQATPQWGKARGGEFGSFAARYASAQGPRFAMFMGRGKHGALVMTALVSTDANAFDAHVRAATASFDSLDFGPDVLAGTPPPSAVPAAAPPAPGAPVPTAAVAGSAALTLPPGWTRSDSVTAVVVSRTVYEQTLGGHGAPIQQFRLLVQPAVRLAEPPTQAFASTWARLVAPAVQTSAHPLPLRRRVASGAAVYFDGDGAAVDRASGRSVAAFLYLVVDGEVAVPVLGLFQGNGDELRRDLGTFFDSLRVPGGTGRRAPLYTLAEVAGTWRASSATMAQFVDSAGNYRGDASLASGETMTIGADGRFESAFAAVGGGNGTIRQHDRGTAAVQDDVLAIPSGGQPRRYRIGGVGRTVDGRAGVLVLSITRDDFPWFNATSAQPGAGDVYVAPR